MNGSWAGWCSSGHGSRASHNGTGDTYVLGQLHSYHLDIGSTAEGARLSFHSPIRRACCKAEGVDCTERSCRWTSLRRSIQAVRKRTIGEGLKDQRVGGSAATRMFNDHGSRVAHHTTWHGIAPVRASPPRRPIAHRRSNTTKLKACACLSLAG